MPTGTCGRKTPARSLAGFHPCDRLLRECGGWQRVAEVSPREREPDHRFLHAGIHSCDWCASPPPLARHFRTPTPFIPCSTTCASARSPVWPVAALRRNAASKRHFCRGRLLLFQRATASADRIFLAPPPHFVCIIPLRPAFLLTGNKESSRTYLSLLPIIGGTAIAAGVRHPPRTRHTRLARAPPACRPPLARQCALRLSHRLSRRLLPNRRSAV